jgi:hypothetical protein
LCSDRGFALKYAFMHCDLGFFDHETGRVECAPNPFGARLLPMSPAPCVRVVAVDTGESLTSEDCEAISRFRRSGRGLMVTRDHMDWALRFARRPASVRRIIFTPATSIQMRCVNEMIPIRRTSPGQTFTQAPTVTIRKFMSMCRCTLS